jgi:hypothetical protein
VSATSSTAHGRVGRRGAGVSANVERCPPGRTHEPSRPPTLSTGLHRPSPGSALGHRRHPHPLRRGRVLVGRGPAMCSATGSSAGRPRIAATPRSSSAPSSTACGHAVCVPADCGPVPTADRTTSRSSSRPGSKATAFWRRWDQSAIPTTMRSWRTSPHSRSSWSYCTSWCTREQTENAPVHLHRRLVQARTHPGSPGLAAPRRVRARLATPAELTPSRSGPGSSTPDHRGNLDAARTRVVPLRRAQVWVVDAVCGPTRTEDTTTDAAEMIETGGRVAIRQGILRWAGLISSPGPRREIA